jgi:hemoglobin
MNRATTPALTTVLLLFLGLVLPTGEAVGQQAGPTKTLYERLGGYSAIAAVANDLLPRLRADPQLGRFWAHRGEDGVMREKQLLIDFLCWSAGGPMYYRGRDMALTHRGMRISDSDWNVFLGHAAATLAKYQVPEAEQRDVVAFVQSLKKEIVE